MVVPRIPPVPSWLWIFDIDVQNQTWTKKKFQTIYRQSRRNSDMVNTPWTVLLLPSPEVSRFSRQGREEALVLVHCRHNRPRTCHRALIFRLKSQNQTDTKAPYHMLNHPAFSVPFSVPFWGGAPPELPTSLARQRHWTAGMHSWSELHQFKTFFFKLKKG